MENAIVTGKQVANDHPNSDSTASGMSPLIRLWLLRLLVPFGLHRNFIQEKEFSDIDLADALGLCNPLEQPDWEYKPSELRMALRKMHKESEQQKESARPPERLSKNIIRIQRLLNLSEIDCRIVEFVVLHRREPLLEIIDNLLGDISDRKVFHTLSVVLGCTELEVRKSLEKKGRLSKSGLISIDQSRNRSLKGKLDILSSEFVDIMLSSEADPVELISDRVIACAFSELGLDDYAHISRSLEILRPYLKHSARASRKGVNIYIHGAPGTGKTELAKVLAKDIGCELFEVVTEDGDGEPLEGEKRLRVLHLAQTFFAQSKALIMFDESEDVFSDRGSFLGSTARLHKAWVNRALEENPVPVLWLSNSNTLDPAFIRRFDMVIELPMPPRQQRKQIVQTICGNMVTAATVERISGAEKMSPAVIARAASVLRCIEGGMESTKISPAIEYLVSSTLEAQGHRPLDLQNANCLPDTYDPAFIHADSDLSALAEGLARTKTGRLCFYGPPGTGKTAFARWLAEQLSLPLLVKRASDLMAPYVGETEQNIARAFREAEQNKALLLIDEVDSFLQDRRGARHSWEVTAVNEMLTQMESFSGIFIASTNLMDNLDQAALRRFDLKIKFDYLKPDQAWNLLTRQCELIGIPTPAIEYRSKLTRLSMLTPGDFAAVARQHRFRPVSDVDNLIASLKLECSIKEGGNRASIGFHTAS